MNKYKYNILKIIKMNKYKYNKYKYNKYKFLYFTQGFFVGNLCGSLITYLFTKLYINKINIIF